MSTATKMNLPRFLNYEENPINTGYETMMDFLLSWTIRCSKQSLRTDYPKLYEQCRVVLFYLIYGRNEWRDAGDGCFIDEPIPADFHVVEALAERQKNYIDLLARVTVAEAGQQKTYILNIENKYYSDLGNNQLCSNAEKAKAAHPDQTIISLLITLDTARDYYEEEKRLCAENDYKFLTIGDINSYMTFPTESELFDTLWSEIG